MNVDGTVRRGGDLGPGHTVVTVLCDFGTRYRATIFKPSFLKGKGLPVAPWLEAAPALPEVFE